MIDMNTMYLCAGDKGGTGKSMVAATLRADPVAE